MTGSTSKYEERGIIPRSLQHIFAAIEKTEVKPTVYISYLEIYNEIGYDLLSPRNSKTATMLEELPRITVLEDKKGEPQLRNLSILPVSTEEEAMRLLFLGETNRAIAETPLNEYSSRSHCIFTIYITSRVNDSQSMIYAKLNLVDLAGSERVYKSQITGNTLNEAKHINLSLHFLQQVILALSESRRSHIPYRNSLMTFILKDSLAGNCLTVMLATLAISRKNIPESISTCRFAQRVSLIRTDAVINEVSDPYQEILLLKNEVQELRKELANRKPIMLLQENTSISQKRKEEIDTELDMYLNSNENVFKANLDPGLYQYCFSVFKNKIKFLENKLKDKEDVLYSIENSRMGKRSITANLQNEDNVFNNFNIEDNVQEMIFSNSQNSEVDYYLKLLSGTYKKAKLLAGAIDVCQVNIGYIREKLDIVSRAGDCRNKILLSKKLEQQQRIYRKSLMELKEFKNETLQLEAGLKQAKSKGTFKTCMQIRKDNQANQSVQDTQTLYYNNENITSKTTRSSGVDIGNEGYCNKYFDEHQMLSEDDFCDMSEDLYAERCYLPSINNASRKTDYLDKSERISNWSKQKSDDTNNSCCDAYRDYVQDEDCLKYPKTLDICHRNGNNFQCHTKRNVPESNYCEFEDNKCYKGCFNSQPLLPPICDTTVQPLYRQSNNHHHILPSKYINITQQKCNKTEDLHCQCKKNNIHPNMEFQSCNESCCTQSHLIQCEYNYICQPYKRIPRNISKTKTEQLLNFTKSERCQNNCLGTENTASNLLSSSLKTDQNNLAIQVVPDKLCRSNSEIDLPQKLHDVIYNFASPNSQEFTTSTNDYVLKFESKEECQKIQCSKIKTETFSHGIFLDTDTEDFKEFMATVQMTGDNEVDKEICMFYRTKMCS